MTIGLQSISIFNVMEYCKSKQRQSIFNLTFNFKFVSKFKNGMDELATQIQNLTFNF